MRNSEYRQTTGHADEDAYKDRQRARGHRKARQERNALREARRAQKEV